MNLIETEGTISTKILILKISRLKIQHMNTTTLSVQKKQKILQHYKIVKSKFLVLSSKQELGASVGLRVHGGHCNYDGGHTVQPCHPNTYVAPCYFWCCFTNSKLGRKLEFWAWYCTVSPSFNFPANLNIEKTG